MSDFLKQDIFFFITSVAVILVTLLVVVALYYFVRILRNVDDISATAKEETHKIVSDIDSVRGEIHTQARSAKDVLSMVVGMFKRRMRGKKRTTKDK